MKRIFFILVCLVLIVISCKKQASCPNIIGKWLLKSTVANGIEIKIPDTASISETVEIATDYTFISSSTKNGKIWNTGKFDCSKVFDVDSISFKKGSTKSFNLYRKTR